MDRRLMDELVRLTASQPRPERASGRVTQVANDGTVWVRLDGSPCETPCERRSVEASAGDVVSVTVRGGRGIVDGNYSKPATDDEAAIAAQGRAEEAMTAADVAKLLALTQTHDHISSDDSIYVPTRPSDYSRRLRFSGTKAASALGLPDGTAYEVVGMCGDASSYAWELAASRLGIYCRIAGAVDGGEEQWGAWSRLLRDEPVDFGDLSDAAEVVPAFDAYGAMSRRVIPAEYNASHWDDHWQQCVGTTASIDDYVHVIRRGGTVTLRGSGIALATVTAKVDAPIAQVAPGYRPLDTVDATAPCPIWVKPDGQVMVSGSARDGRTVSFNATYAVA